MRRVLPLLAAGAVLLPAAAGARSSPPLAISFSGYSWQVKATTGKVGPGPNYFSGSAQNVWVDGQGRLHLAITRVKGRWWCAEVTNTQSLGYGTYTFTLDTAVNALDPNVVLGLFTWNDDPAYAHRELDVEFARWGNAADPTNAQYVVQPWDSPGHLLRVTQTSATTSSVSFRWQSGSVGFSATSASPSPWTYTGSDVPIPGGEHPHLNLWLDNGSAPANGSPVEVVVESFTFTPA
jgi:hypothetical protein